MRIHWLWLLVALFFPTLACGQSIEERLARIEKRLDQLEKMLDAKVGAGKAVTVTTEPYSWTASPVTGKVIRIDGRNGDVTVIHTGKPGKWEVVRAEPYFWLLSASGAVVRLDKRNGDNSLVFTGKPGGWELVGKTEGSYIVMTNADTGAVLRFDKRNGETSVIDNGK